MGIKNTLSEYGSIAKLLHWGIFAMFVGMFIVAEVMMDMDKGPDKWQLYGLHKSTGIIIFAVVVLRIIWKFINISPALPNQLKIHEKILAHTVMLALYICMIGLPVSGYIMSVAGGHGISLYGFIDIINLINENKELAHNAHEMHELFATAIYILVPIHILAALYHHKILKDNVLTRMLPKRN